MDGLVDGGIHPLPDSRYGRIGLCGGQALDYLPGLGIALDKRTHHGMSAYQGHEVIYTRIVFSLQLGGFSLDIGNLFFIHQRELASGVLVHPGRGNLREEVCRCYPAVVSRHFHFCPLLIKGLVLCYCHLTACIQGKDAILCICRDSDQCQHHAGNTHQSFHFTIFVFTYPKMQTACPLCILLIIKRHTFITNWSNLSTFIQFLTTFVNKKEMFYGQ